MSRDLEPLVIYTHRDDLSAEACERIREALAPRPVEFEPLPSPAPAAAFKRVVRQKYENTSLGMRDAEAEAEAREERRDLTKSIVSRCVDAREELLETTLADIGNVFDLIDALDAHDARREKTFLEHHARTLEAHASRTATEKALRGELSAARKLMGELIDNAMIDPCGDWELVQRLVAFREGE